MSKYKSKLFLMSTALAGLAACSNANHRWSPPEPVPGPGRAIGVELGRVEISTLQLPAGVTGQTAHFTPSGKIMLRYSGGPGTGTVKLATLDDDGSDFRPFFGGQVPDVPQNNGVRFMLFPDGKRIHMGDYVLECTKVFEECDDATIVPIKYPDPLDRGALLSHRWSENLIAPDNETVAWTALLADYSAIGLTGALEREADRYVIADTHIISTVERFEPDPDHPDGVIPVEPVFNGEVKQFVHGGAAISTAGGKDLDTTDSTVLLLDSGGVEQITYTPGYDETTIFSPDERLGMVMTTRFSETTDLAFLGIIPRPHQALGMNLNRYMYAHGVTGVRASREGNVGPALIDIERSRTEPGYLGESLATDADWVYRSPMSWRPDGKMALWPEGSRSTGSRRIQIVRLPDYQPGPSVPTRPTPIKPGSTTDLGAAERFMDAGASIDVKVYGRRSGHITYQRDQAADLIQKTYVNFSDDGDSVFNGWERMDANLAANSVYSVDLQVTGKKPGVMQMQVTFGRLGGAAPARLIFDPEISGLPATRGFVEYDGTRINIEDLNLTRN